MIPLLSPFLQRARFSAVATYIRGDVLDLGCGHAEALPLLTKSQAYIGVENGSEIIEWLQTCYPEREFHNCDLDSDELNLNWKFDTVLMLAVVEHLKNPSHILRQLPRYLKDGGRVLITTPSPLGDKIHRIGARLGVFSIIAVHDHEVIYTDYTLRPLLALSGLAVLQYRRFLLGGNQLFVCAAA